MSSSYGLKPKFDIKEDPVYSNIQMIAEKSKGKWKNCWYTQWNY